MCGEYPTVYERIAAHYDWILDHTEDATYCKNKAWENIIEGPSSTNENSITNSIENTNFDSTTLGDEEQPEFSLNKSVNIFYDFSFNSDIHLLFFFIIYCQNFHLHN